MAKTTGDNQRIALKTSGRKEEAAASVGGIEPGMLIQINADKEMLPHDTAGGDAEIFVVLEDGKIGRTVETPYTAEDGFIEYVNCQAGDEVMGILVAGESYDNADKLTSNGDGRLKKAGADDVIVAVCDDPLDLTTAGAVHTLSAIRTR